MFQNIIRGSAVKRVLSTNYISKSTPHKFYNSSMILAPINTNNPYMSYSLKLQLPRQFATTATAIGSFYSATNNIVFNQSSNMSTTTKPSLDKLRITHEPQNNRFVIYPSELNTLYPGDPKRVVTDEDGPAKLTYKIFVASNDENSANNKKMICDFDHTFCPVPMRGGSGVSEYLVEYGLTWATTQGYEIKGSCWYVAKFLPFTPKNQKQEEDARL